MNLYISHILEFYLISLTNFIWLFSCEDDTEGEAKDEDGEEKKEGDETDAAKDEGATEEASTSKDAKAMVKEAIDKLPKMPKIHKPAFLKKGKKEGEGEEGQATNLIFPVCFL